jgi:cytidylate kinase
VAVDGPSGAGKSTAARALARRLGYVFVDTGAMYRALTLKAIRQGIDSGDEARLAELLSGTRIELLDAGTRVLLDGVDVTSEIRTPEVSTATSLVSAHAAVRRAMVIRQQDLGRSGGIVMDGRDIGSTVFPDAEVKFFVDAEAAARAGRRYRELISAGVDADPAVIERETRERDYTDSTRTDSPLARAADAVHLDTTLLSPEDVVERMLETVEARSPVRR